MAAAATGGEVTIRGARPDHLHAVLDKLRDQGGSRSGTQWPGAKRLRAMAG